MTERSFKDDFDGERVHPRGGKMTTKWKTLIGCACCLALGLIIYGCDDARVLEACDDRVVNVGFYADFEPLSYSRNNQAPAISISYNTHRGYEADLLNAVGELDGVELSFSRRGIPPLETDDGRTFPFSGIWLLAAEPEYDLIGGGITIRQDRTLDDDGRQAVAFTQGHVAFRQSLLVRREDARRLADIGNLTADDVVSVHRGTTGEERLLQSVGIVDDEGVLVAGTRVVTPTRTLTADGSSGYTITAAMPSPELSARQRIIPPAPFPQVVLHTSLDQQLEALYDGDVDALSRGDIGNRNEALLSGRTLEVTAPDTQAEYGGFAVDAGDGDLLACLNEAIELVTDGGRIGYSEWAANPMVFLERAENVNRE